MDKISKTKMIGKIAPILKKMGVKRAGIFGSYAKGSYRKDSDIDILVKLDNKSSLLDLIRIKLNLEKETNKKVDVIEYNTLHPLIKKSALKEERRII